MSDFGSFISRPLELSSVFLLWSFQGVFKMKHISRIESKIQIGILEVKVVTSLCDIGVFNKLYRIGQHKL